MHIAVVGAGAFGGWTALHLLRQGVQVTLVDPWGPGHSRASSGGETRAIRGIYGLDGLYTQWVADSITLWRELEKTTGTNLLHITGCLWMFSEPDDSYARNALPHLAQAGLPAYEWHLEVAKKRYPQICLDDIHSVFYEETAGYLEARKACQAINHTFLAEGGTFFPRKAMPGRIQQGKMDELKVSGRRPVKADGYVFACGPWLKTLFPDVLSSFLQVSRQPLLYFGTPEADQRFHPPSMPTWIDFGEQILYGIPGGAYRGFKIGDDTRGSDFDPSGSDRRLHKEDLEQARAALKRRFPLLANAPLIESRICQYSNSPDGEFLIDQHPEAENVWLVGAGSGHSFKLSPRLGAYVAQVLLNHKKPNPRFTLERDHSSRLDRITQFGTTA